jgi:hypothetical protein
MGADRAPSSPKSPTRCAVHSALHVTVHCISQHTACHNTLHDSTLRVCSWVALALWVGWGGACLPGGALRLHIGAKLDWDVAVFPSFKEGQTVQTARAVVMEWIQAQQDSVRWGGAVVLSVQGLIRRRRSHLHHRLHCPTPRATYGTAVT